MLFFKALLDVCKKYFTSCGYDNPKLLCGVSTGDYREHLKNHRNEYDVIITGMIECYGNKPEFPGFLRQESEWTLCLHAFVVTLAINH